MQSNPTQLFRTADIEQNSIYNDMLSIFPPQQYLSITDVINTDLPGFIPHSELIFIGISDLFETKIQSLSGLSYLNSLKSSNNNNDKAIAAEIARWHNQIDFAKECVQDIDDNALCKRMQLMLNNVGEHRQQIKDNLATAPFQKNDEYKFVLLDYNLQTFTGSTSDRNAIDILLKTECENMKYLLSNDNCSWRFHLIYASLLCRISLDDKAIETQIDLATSKLGGNPDSNYLFQALIGEIYCRMREFEKARKALNKACCLWEHDGYCRTRLIYTYLYERNFNKAIEIWLTCCMDLKSGGIDEEILNCYTNYIKMEMNSYDEENNNTILEWIGDDKHSFIGSALKLYVTAYKSEKYIDDDRFGITEDESYEKTSRWIAKHNDLAQKATHKQRMVALFLRFFVEMYTNDEAEVWDMQGSLLDNVFAIFYRPLLDDILDALYLENYLLGMFKLRWKADCKNAFRFSIICNCRGNINCYIGEVLGFHNAGMSDIAVQKIEETQKFVRSEALEMYWIDAKRMSDDEKLINDAKNDLIQLIQANSANYNAMLALADLYLSKSIWQSALLLMQQVVECRPFRFTKNLEFRMKWATVLFFNGYLPLANQIFREYINTNLQSLNDEYYCGIAANIFYELGKQKYLDKMEAQNKFKGQNIWMLRYLCYKYWVEFYKKRGRGKKKPKQPKSGGKSQYDKAIDCAMKIIRLSEDHPLGYALLARSQIELINTFTGDAIKEKIVKSVDKSVELADELLREKAILPRMYYESMVDCGIAIYQIGLDGSKYYEKALYNAPHGETPLMRLQLENITSKMDTQQTRELLREIEKNQLNIDEYKKPLSVFKYDFDETVCLANKWNIFDGKTDLVETNWKGINITKSNMISIKLVLGYSRDIETLIKPTTIPMSIIVMIHNCMAPYRW